jgi:hypothetical protein
MPNGATMMNAHPPPLVAAGTELPTLPGLTVRPLCDGATAGDPFVLKLGTALGEKTGLDEKTGLEGVAGGGAGAFIDET